MKKAKVTLSPLVPTLPYRVPERIGSLDRAMDRMWETGEPLYVFPSYPKPWDSERAINPLEVRTDKKVHNAYGLKFVPADLVKWAKAQLKHKGVFRDAVIHKTVREYILAKSIMMPRGDASRSSYYVFIDGDVVDHLWPDPIHEEKRVMLVYHPRGNIRYHFDRYTYDHGCPGPTRVLPAPGTKVPVLFANPDLLSNW